MSDDAFNAIAAGVIAMHTIGVEDAAAGALELEDALAVRRSLSNIAAKDLGSVLLTDVSGTSINRYEVELAAALTASSQQFHLHNEERFKHHTGGWNVAFHACTLLISKVHSGLFFNS